jgi:hypothetical protein
MGIYLGVNQSALVAFKAIVTFHTSKYQPTPILISIIDLPAFIIPTLSLWVGLLLGLVKKQIKLNELNIYSLLMMGLCIPFILFRPYHHYWLPILPYLIILSVPIVQLSSRLKWGLIINLVVAGIFWSGYTLLVANPTQQQQLRQISDMPCSQITEPIGYYLKNCRPPYEISPPVLVDTSNPYQGVLKLLFNRQ